MKKTISIILIVAFIVTLSVVSCKKKTSNPTPQKTYSELIVGRWMTSDGGHFEVYNSDGTGKMWDPAEDVQEEDADTFDWTIEGSHMTQMIHFQGGQGEVPQYCNIITLNESHFTYNNEGWRAEYSLVKVN